MTPTGKDIFLPNIELNERKEIIGFSIIQGKLHKVIDNDIVIVEIVVLGKKKILIKYKNEVTNQCELE